MNLNDMQKVDFDKEYTYVTHEQLVMAEHFWVKGFELYVEGPYKCGYSGKEYCYVWAIKEGVKNGVQKINGLGYTVNR